MPGTTTAAPFKCPQCGADNDLPTGVRILSCAFCSATLFVDRAGVVSHYRLPRLVDREHALEALRRWMNGNETVKDLDQKSEITAAEAIAFPMWLFRAKAEGGGEDVRVEPAAATPVAELAELELPAGKLEPFSPEGGAVETVAATVPLETARGWLGDEGARLTEMALVEVPVWRCRYTYRGEEFLALVEGSTGQVSASIFPAKAESPYYAVAAIGFVLFLIEGLAVSNPLFKAALYLATSVPLALAALVVTRKV